MRRLFNDGWLFSEQPVVEKFRYSECNKNNIVWKQVAVPHDWLISDVSDLYRDSEGWYKKEFLFHKTEFSETVLLEFDGIYMDSSVYLNGVQVFEWKNGSTNQLIDISTSVKEGRNTVFVRARYQSPNARWYTGAGIYRNIWLHQLPQTACLPYDNYVHVQALDDKLISWELDVETRVTRQVSAPEHKLEVNYYLKDSDNKVVCQKSDLVSGDTLTKHTKLIVDNPQLWSPDSPYLYSLETIITSSEQRVEQKIVQKVGFKQVTLDSNKGMLLNGEHVKIHGVCEHECNSIIGARVSRDAIKRSFNQLKLMGANAIRMAHNPFSQEFVELADELGFLLISEFSDVWKLSKTKYDYSRFFDNWHQRDVKSWIKRDRSHVSILFWSIGNEIFDTHTDKNANVTANELISLVKKYDYLNNAKVTLASNYLLWEPTQRIATLVDAVGYNYGENLYADQHKKFPDWKIYGSETFSIASSRGVYHFPLRENILTDDDLQCSSLGNSATSWGAKSAEKNLIADADNKYSLGQFIWTGHDYLGEPTPYHTKNSYLGQIDTAGFYKDAFYVIRAAWTSAQSSPFIHIFPYWNFNNDQVIDVRVCTNATKCELFFDNKSLGMRNLTKDHRLIGDWQIPYRAGKLTAVAYSKNDDIVASDEVENFGDTKSIEINANSTTNESGSNKILFISLRALDAKKRFVANANNILFVSVKSGGRLLGLDNGDSTDESQYQCKYRRLFNGLLMAMVEISDSARSILLEVHSPGVDASRCVVKISDCGLASVQEKVGIGVKKNSVVGEKSTKIPIRQIVLNAKNLEFDQDHSVELVTTEILPKNATNHDLSWRLTDKKGITSDIAVIEKQRSNSIKIKPTSNGSGYIRCVASNDSDHPEVISSREFKITGYKSHHLDPYAEISGGLFSRSNVELTAGNERGIATLRGTESYVCFDQVDFGKFGTSRLLVSFFPLDKGEIPFELWQGYPHSDGSTKIAELKFTKGSVWNTYLEQEYQLPHKICGNQTISLVFQQKVHIKFIKFFEINPLWSENSILDADLTYGDSYTVEDDQISRIGNNVTFVFDHVNFENGAKQIIITGSASKKNSIELKYTNSNHQEQTTILNFPEGDTRQTVTFDIPTWVGSGKLEFIFLPGSNFNFSNFRFVKGNSKC